MTTATDPDPEVMWATSTTGEDFQCVHVQAWRLAQARIAELEAALRVITYSDGGAVRNSFQHYVDLTEKAPILRAVHDNK